MNIKQNTFILLSCIGVLSCDASTTTNQQVLQPALDFSLPNRQILSLDENPLRIDVVVNNGVNQRFNIPGGANTANITVSGIRQGEPALIQITWTEILNGEPVILAQQDQVFSADGNIIVDTDHQFELFDWDDDGVSNLEERANGTCVWSADNECLTDGGLDVPPDLESRIPSVDEDDVWINAGYTQTGVIVSSDEINSSVATIREHDFSNGADVWAAPIGDLSVDNDSMCVAIPNGQVGFQHIIAYDNVDVSLAPGSYMVQFDVRANRLAPVNFTLTQVDVSLRPTLERYVQGTNEWVTHTIRFENNAQVEVGMGLLGLRGPRGTTYCFRDIKLVRI